MPNILSIVSKVLPIIGKITGLPILGDAGKALDSVQLSPEKQAELDQALMQHEKDMAAVNLDAFKSVVSEAIAEVQSPDKFVSRARPTGFYAFVLFNLAIGFGLLIGWHPDTVQLEAIGFIEGALGGNAAFWQKLRSDDKKLTN